MSVEPSDIEKTVLALSQRVAGLESRLLRLEAGRSFEGEKAPEAGRMPEAELPPDLAPPPLESGLSLPEERPFGGGVVPLIGRTLVALGGAFLIRAVTENHLLPEKAGVGIGIAYAFVWLVMADRAGRGARTGASFHGLTSALILFPLLWESTARFHFLSPPASALTLCAAAVTALTVAARRRLGAMAAGFALGSAAMSMVLVPVTGAPFPFAAALIVIGLASLWRGYLSGGGLLARVMAGITDIWILMLVVFRLLTTGASGSMSLPATQLFALQISLVVAYVGSFAVRTLLKGREITNAEIIQSVAAIAVGFGGAVAVTGAAKSSFLPLGVSGLAFGVANYGVAFAFVAGSAGRGRNFHFYSTMALLFTLIALPLLVTGPMLGVAYSGGAIGAVGLGVLGKRPTLSLHGSVYVIAAMITSGLLLEAGRALWGVPGGTPGPAALLSLGAAALSIWIMPPRDNGGEQTLRRFLKSLTLAVVAAAAGGCVVDLVCRLGRFLPPAPAAIVTGTAVLSLIPMVLAWLGRWKRFSEALRLVYPVLAVTGMKVIVRDLTTRRSEVIFASLALYGTALILSPRILRASRERQKNRGRPVD